MNETIKHRILVVEDDTFSRDLLYDWLEMEGFEAVTAADLDSGITAVKTQAPDLVLLDIKLGQHNGLTLVSWLRQQPELCHIPVIAVTAHAMVTDRERVLEAGCNACIPKPIDFKVLRECLQQRLVAPDMPQVQI